MIAINDLEFAKVPSWFPSFMEAHLSDGTVVGYDFEYAGVAKRELYVREETGEMLHSSKNPCEWPGLDRRFGRKAWQAFVEEKKSAERTAWLADNE